MKLLILLGVLAFAVAQTLGDDGQVKEKLAKIQDIIKYINKPYNKVPSHNALFPRDTGSLDKREVYSVFDKNHWTEANRVMASLMDATPFDEFIKTCQNWIHIREVNRDLFTYVFLVALAHRPDTRDLPMPRVQDIWPDKFFMRDVFIDIREKVHAGETPVVVNDTREHVNLQDQEHALSYFTEDMGLNSLHYHWHVMNPSLWSAEYGQRHSRRGERFYWMHRQMLARYDAERFSNNLPRTTPFEEWDWEIETGYSPYLVVDYTGYQYTFRPDGLVLQNLPDLSKNDLRMWQARLGDAVDSGFVRLQNRTKVNIHTHRCGLDILGNLVEASKESANIAYYGNLHSSTHVIASKIADPENKYEVDNGVMYDVATAARDPLFYRWHKFIDNIFERYLQRLPEHDVEEMIWNDIKIESVAIDGDKSVQPNKIVTYWDTHTFELDKGFSFNGDNTAQIKVKHLQHEGFKYVIDVVNNGNSKVEAAVRIFLAPAYDEKGEPFKFNDHRRFMIQMDAFTHTLKPGKNTITVHSSESRVTARDGLFYNKADDAKHGMMEYGCSCGWPEYLAVPKGKPEGMDFKLTVSITNWAQDQTDKIGSPTNGCPKSPLYCGANLNDVHDKRAPGFPYDRWLHSYPESVTVDDIHDQVQNFYVTDVVIKFVGDAPKSTT